jgi:hypothetical protein
MEIWREVPSVPGLAVSLQGRVKILPYDQPMPHGGFKRVIGRPRKGNASHRKRVVNFVFKRKAYKVARLVCETFHGPPPSPTAECRHWDGNLENNHANNLRWVEKTGTGNQSSSSEIGSVRSEAP